MNLQIERDSVVVLQGVFVEGDGARRALKVRIGDGNRLLLGRIDDFEFEQLVDPGDVDRSFSRRQGVVEADSNYSSTWSISAPMTGLAGERWISEIVSSSSGW